MKYGIIWFMAFSCLATLIVSCSKYKISTFVIPENYNGFICVKAGDNGVLNLNEAVVSEEGYVVLRDFSTLEGWTKVYVRSTNGDEIPNGLTEIPSNVYFWTLGRSHNGSLWMFVGTREQYAQVAPSWSEIIGRNDGVNPSDFSF